MNTLHAGFSRVNITPPLGIGMQGYYRKRQAEGVLDELEANCLCLACGETKVALISVDHIGTKCDILQKIRHEVQQVTGIPAEAVYIHCTHTHTGPFVVTDSKNPQEQEYYPIFCRKLVDSVVMAVADLKPARMGYAMSYARDVAFVRRYMMKDGKVRTNPDMNDPNVVGPAGEVDERVNVLRFDREDDSIILANFGNHPDTVGGKLISADWPGFVRQYTERAIPGTKCLFFNGAQGDVNHEKRDREEWETGNGYDYNNAKHIGRVVTGSILQVFDKMHYVDVDTLKFVLKNVQAPANKAAPEQLPEAHRINDMYVAGMKQREILPDVEGMLRTTLIAEAARMVRLENGPDFFELPVTGIAVGPVAFVGIPGEPFTDIGRALKETDAWAMVLPTCLTNGSEGYYPMMDGFEEGGYEARSSSFKAGIAELLIEAGKQVLQEMKL